MPTAEPLFAPIAIGELIDKITILEIKEARIADPAKRRNVSAELALLCEIRDRHVAPDPQLHDLAGRLKLVNQTLWQVEDDIRDHERRQDYGARFVELARMVYQQNDLRFSLKRQINELAGSALVEEKSYGAY